MVLFEIKNLKCSYNSEQVVLEIERLSISSGKLVVILGLSGAGKSTFLETIGLMNNTMLNGSSIQFTPDKEESYEYHNLWNNRSGSGIYDVRRLHFSFIFQNTNLMPNFTVYENICLTQLLQGESMKKAVQNAKAFMEQIGLDEIDEKKKSYELSGGQAQRVAFVRAITPDFTVLFGDEPTGNLDEKNSWDLMSMLKKKVVGMGKTAIIVTHNLKLALDFADQIILITKPNAHGKITDDNIFSKSDSRDIWENKKYTFDSVQMDSYLKNSLDV